MNWVLVTTGATQPGKFLCCGASCYAGDMYCLHLDLVLLEIVLKCRKQWNEHNTNKEMSLLIPYRP